MITKTVNTSARAPRSLSRRFIRPANLHPSCDSVRGEVDCAQHDLDSVLSELPHNLSDAPDASGAEAWQARIVCGTDFSIHAREAADVTTALASRLGMVLTLVHIAEPDRGSGTSKSLNAMLRYRNRNRFKEEAERLRACGVTVEEAFLPGSPATDLVKVAVRQHAALIVISSLGHVSPTRWLLGSVAEQTANLSPVPVLVVRNPKPFIDWAAGKRSLHIVVGHDFSASADAALAWVATLRKVGRCRITVAHLAATQLASGWLEVNDTPRSKRSLVEVRELLKGDLMQRCRGPLGKSRFQVDVNSVRNSVAPHLVSLAKMHRADLIVVGTNQKGTLRRLCLGSVSRQVLRCTQTNVVCVPGANTGRERFPSIPA